MVDRAIWEKAVFEVLDATGGNIETGGFIDAVLAKVTTATGATPPRGTAASYMSLLLTRERLPGGGRRYARKGAGGAPAPSVPVQATAPTVAAPSPPAGPPDVAQATAEAPAPPPVQAPPEPTPEPPPPPEVKVVAPIEPEEPLTMEVPLPAGADIDKYRRYRGRDQLFFGSLWFPHPASTDAYSNKWTVIWPPDPTNKDRPYGDTWDILVPTEVAHDEYVSNMVGTPSPTDPRVGTDVWLLQRMYEPEAGKSADKTGKKAHAPGAVLMMGHTGTGKTHSIFAALGDPDLLHNKAAESGKFPWEFPRVYRAVMSAMSPEQIIGQWIPNEHKREGHPEDPAFIWVDGVLTRMVRYGGVFIADEINMTAADVLAAVNSLLDDQHFLTLTQKSGQIVRAHPDFWFIAAGNPVGPEYGGVKPINAALRSRFSMVFWYTWNTEYETQHWPENKSTGAVRNEWVHHLFHELRQSFLRGQLKYPASSRDMAHLMQNLKLGEATGSGASPAFISLLYLYGTATERSLVRESIAKNIPDKSVGIEFPSESAEE